MFRPYSRVLRTPNVVRPFIFNFLASLPIGMLTLGVLLLIQSTTDSFTRAGLASGALSIGNAIGLVVQGRLIDRHGQTIVLVVGGLLCGSCFVLLPIAAEAHAPFGLAIGLAATGGASIPAVNTSMRVLLPKLLPQQEIRTTAYALLGTQFHLAMITGPLVVSALLMVANPTYAVTIAGVLATVGSVLFASTPASRGWRPAAPSGDEPGSEGASDLRATLTPGLLTLLIAGFGSGIATGLVNVAVPAVAVSYGAASLAGLLFAAQSIGDLLGGIVYGGRTWRLPVRHRLVCCQLVGATGCVLLAVTAGSPDALVLLMFPLMFGTGLFQAPAGIVSSQLLDDVARAERLGRSYTSIVASMLLGLAGGNAIGGALGDVATEWTLFATAACVLAAVASSTFVRRATLTAVRSSRQT